MEIVKTKQKQKQKKNELKWIMLKFQLIKNRPPNIP